MNLTPQQLQERVDSFRFWYHKIDLGHGIVTPGLDLEPIWDTIRKARSCIDYQNKKVLDIASFDGMWAFEAEKLGADVVVATDVYFETYKNFLFCREVLNSKVIPYYNVSPYDLWNRLDVYFQENWGPSKPYDRLFDVVQHLGLLYHLRDPMLTLSQARSVIRTGGYLLIETAFIANEDGPFMLFNGIPPDRQRISQDMTTWWAPTLPCLKEMLRASLFEPLDETVHIVQSNWLKATFKQLISSKKYEISRVSLVARAVASEDVDSEYFRELARTYRNPGLVAEHLGNPPNLGSKE